MEVNKSSLNLSYKKESPTGEVNKNTYNIERPYSVKVARSLFYFLLKVIKKGRGEEIDDFDVESVADFFNG